MAGNGVRPIVVLALAGGTFAVLQFVVGTGLVISLLGAFGGFVVGNVIMTGKKKSLPATLVDGIDRIDYEAALKTAWNKHRVIVNEAFKINNPPMRKKVDAIADVVKRVLDDVKADPSDFRQARQFLEYYLDATVKIIQRYVELYEKSTGNPEIKESLIRVEETLDTIKDAFEKQLRILLENDKMDLDIELTVLKRTIELEGLGKEPGAP